ncbi:hypothetical protein [Pseudomonas fluorescens]|nr:hypothetical protein [Pseudomonas fluorescens]
MPKENKLASQRQRCEQVNQAIASQLRRFDPAVSNRWAPVLT